MEPWRSEGDHQVRLEKVTDHGFYKGCSLSLLLMIGDQNLFSFPPPNNNAQSNQ
jgi:hypothetical protein